jgi:hypothetical protein
MYPLLLRSHLHNERHVTLPGDPEIKKVYLSTLRFQRKVAAVKLSDRNPINENETCGIKTRQDSWDFTGLESAYV